MKKNDKPITAASIVATLDIDRNFNLLLQEVINERAYFRELSRENDENGLNQYIFIEHTDSNGRKFFVDEMIECESQRNFRINLERKETLVTMLKEEKKKLEESGLKFRVANSAKASKARPKTIDNVTITELIERLVRDHNGEKPMTIWTHFKVSLEEWTDNKVTDSGKGQNSRYHFQINDDKGTYTFGTFRKKIRTIKKTNGI
ncbi:hypothetical protein [Undibacterium oligocarboniphilum]|uniref:Uncharacterized protein n=1 Tax=Undibacterium oligocarboniphilum TaxID=666702 RepID=A0A850QNL4_9BURK|nr:hypothetical protein [Undibacterium oligocarboniphilum]MBC3870299.1 hypothetical protein [Undibacterium oligocarboniphilum]NVO78290.1 hypothetical protein [Undibacterium oligocarboniphilum]